MFSREEFDAITLPMGTQLESEDEEEDEDEIEEGKSKEGSVNEYIEEVVEEGEDEDGDERREEGGEQIAEEEGKEVYGDAKDVEVHGSQSHLPFNGRACTPRWGSIDKAFNGLQLDVSFSEKEGNLTPPLEVDEISQLDDEYEDETNLQESCSSRISTEGAEDSLKLNEEKEEEDKPKKIIKLSEIRSYWQRQEDLSFSSAAERVTSSSRPSLLSTTVLDPSGRLQANRLYHSLEDSHDQPDESHNKRGQAEVTMSPVAKKEFEEERGALIQQRLRWGREHKPFHHQRGSLRLSDLPNQIRKASLPLTLSGLDESQVILKAQTPRLIVDRSVEYEALEVDGKKVVELGNAESGEEAGEQVEEENWQFLDTLPDCKIGFSSIELSDLRASCPSLSPQMARTQRAELTQPSGGEVIAEM
ncbi:unnamed protein product [Protopolystoma xenopodis]|uniref:Uncharacterized protein n=1 Tax=Protopolystoma xenopodis TaxID=117903 RepID=A0A448XDJ3_9PLAT|nr:unnamed protein product [Protopolystoma xenopodis]